MKPASKQESIVMVKETFIPRSTKSQTILFFLLLVLVSLAFAAGVLLGPRISPSRCGIRSKDDEFRSARNERSSSVCITKDDLIILVATLKPSLQNAPQGPSSFKTKFVTREASRTQSPSTQSPSTTGSSKDLKALIMANLTAHLNRTFVEMLSEKLGECASVGVRHETTRPTVVTTVKSTTTTTTRSTDEEKGSPNPTEAITPTLTGICPGGWKAYSGSCYTMKRAAVDKWETARDLCRMDNSDLVSIASPEENDFVYELARAEAPQFKYMWMGMRRPTPLGSFSWVDDTSRALAYQNWAKGEPNNEQNTGENCVHMYISPDKGREGQWNDEKCANTSNGGPMAYMCKGNPTSKRVNEIGGSGLECGSGSGNFLEEMICPKGWSHFQGSCFKLNSAAPTQNWDQANLACQSMFSYLVVIDSREENQFVYQLARATAPNYKYMWIGLHRSSSLDAFRWSEFNTAPAYHNWAKGEPNNDRNNGENCVHMYLTSFKGKQTQWNDERCLKPGNGGPMVYMCERPDSASEPSGLITTTESGSENFNQNEIDFRDDDIWYEN